MEALYNIATTVGRALLYLVGLFFGYLGSSLYGLVSVSRRKIRAVTTFAVTSVSQQPFCYGCSWAMPSSIGSSPRL